MGFLPDDLDRCRIDWRFQSSGLLVCSPAFGNSFRLDAEFGEKVIDAVVARSCCPGPGLRLGIARLRSLRASL